MLVRKNATVHIDATHKVVKPLSGEKTDSKLKNCLQLISFSVFSEQLNRHVAIFGVFARPAGSQTFTRIFEDFFRIFGLPAPSSYAGFSSDYASAILKGFIVAFTNWKRKTPLNAKEIMSQEKLVYAATNYWRGCYFHYNRSLKQLHKLVPESEMQDFSNLLNQMLTEENPDRYDQLDAALVHLSNNHPGLVTWLAWWRSENFGIRMRGTHWRYLRASNARKLTSTNNSQEGIHSIFKVKYGLRSCPDLWSAVQKLSRYFEDLASSLNYTSRGGTTSYRKAQKSDLSKGPPIPPKTSPKKQKIPDGPKSEYELEKMVRFVSTSSDISVSPRIACDSPMPTFIWNNFSCAWDALISACLIPYLMLRIPSEGSPRSAFFEEFLDVLRTSPGLSDRNTKRLQSAKIRLIALAKDLPEDNLPHLRSSIRTTLDEAGLFLLPEIDCLISSPMLGVTEISNSGENKPSILSDIFLSVSRAQNVPLPLEARLPSVIFYFTSKDLVHTRSFPLMLRQYTGGEIHTFTLCSIIMHDERGGGHFSSILLLASQTSSSHLLPIGNHKFAQSGIFFHDPMNVRSDAEQIILTGKAKAATVTTHEAYVRGLRNSALHKNLCADTLADMQINRKTVGNLFAKKNPSYPHVWIYTHSHTESSTKSKLNSPDVSISLRGQEIMKQMAAESAAAGIDLD
jgi:hypothetical protein